MGAWSLNYYRSVMSVASLDFVGENRRWVDCMLWVTLCAGPDSHLVSHIMLCTGSPITVVLDWKTSSVSPQSLSIRRVPRS